MLLWYSQSVLGLVGFQFRWIFACNPEQKLTFFFVFSIEFLIEFFADTWRANSFAVEILIANLLLCTTQKLNIIHLWKNHYRTEEHEESAHNTHRSRNNFEKSISAHERNFCGFCCCIDNKVALFTLLLYEHGISNWNYKKKTLHSAIALIFLILVVVVDFGFNYVVVIARCNITIHCSINRLNDFLSRSLKFWIFLVAALFALSK